MRFCSAVFILLLSGSLLAPPARGAETLRFTDDRDQPITSALEVCFQTDTRNDCVPVSGGRLSKVPDRFWALRVEGPDHGPVTVQRSAIRVGEGGTAVLKVPRKAELQIQARPDLRVTVSVYAQDDPSFRAPSFRSEVLGGGSLKVPAGEELVSLTAAGQAPDLHLVSAPPGSRRRLSFEGRVGWSLVLRCRARKDGRLLAGAAVRAEGAEGFAPPDARPIPKRSAAKGLVLVSGLSWALAKASVEHPDFVPLQVNGLSASPGTFTFREAEMEEGATLRAAVTLDGQPARGTACQILDYDPNPRGPAPEAKILFSGTADAQGICRSGRLAAGPYALRLRAVEGRSFVDRSIVLVAGEETAVDVALHPLHLSGEVHRGSQPAPSFFITFSEIDEIKPNATRRDAQAEAMTDEEGRYSTVLWAPGDYLALLESPSGTPAASRHLRIEADDDHLDFHLEENGVAGVVIDERGKPVEGTRVYLTWNLNSHRLGDTDAEGRFLFPVSEPGTGKIQAMKSGYLAPEPVEVAVQPETPVTPLVIQMKKAATITGHVAGAIGPGTGAALESYRLDPGGRTSFLGRTVAGPEGAFEVAAAEGAPTRLFVTGAGCPLSVFDVQPTAGDDLMIRCPAVGASLELTLEDPQGKPLGGRTVLVRRDGAFIPASSLIDHLSRFHLPAATDGGGRLFLVGLAPGRYEVYLADSTSPDLVALGVKEGFLTSADLAPAATTELKITVE